MTPRERVAAAYDLRTPDRVPVTELCVNHPVASALLGREAWTGFGGYVRGKLHNDLLIDGRRDEYAERFTTDTLEVNRRLEFDVFQIQILPERGAPARLSRVGPHAWRHEERDGRWDVHVWNPGNDFYGEEDSSFRRDPARELRLMIDDLARDPVPHYGDGQWDFARRARREFPDHFLWGGAGFWIPYTAEGLASLGEDEDLWCAYAERLCEYQKANVDLQLAEGVDAFWCGSDWAFKTGPLLSPAMFRRIFLKPWRELVRHIHARGVKYIKHTDGNIGMFEEMWFGEIGMDGYHAIEPAAGVDIVDLRRRRPGLLLHGNLDCGALLTQGTPGQVETEVIRLARALGPGAGWVFSSSNSIHSGIPLTNVLAMLAAVRHHGTAPFGSRPRLYDGGDAA